MGPDDFLVNFLKEELIEGGNGRRATTPSSFFLLSFAVVFRCSFSRAERLFFSRSDEIEVTLKIASLSL